MATATTATFNPNRGRVVQLALMDVGAIGPGEVSPTAAAAPYLQFANDTLNALIKSMDVDGVLGWRDNPRTLTTTTGSQPVGYVLPADIYDLDQPARYVISGQTTGSPLYPMSRDEYYSLGDWTLTASIPIRYYVQKNLDATTGLQVLTLFLYPNAANAGDTVSYSAQQKARDQNTDADTLDVNQKWIRCLRYGLAADMAPAFGLPEDRIQGFLKIFEDERSRCLMDDGERGDVQLVPFGQSVYGPYGRGDFR